MKKVFYFILFISLFLVGSFVKADSDWSSCWTDPKYIDFETFYNRDNFHTMVYVCNEEKNPVPFNSACFESEDTARDLCKGTYHSNGAYKGNGSSYTTGKCSKQVVYNCWDCKYTCKYEDSYACQCGNYCDNDDDGEKDDYCCLNTCYEWKTQKFEKLVGAAASEKDTGGELKDEWVEESENACKGLSDRNYSFEGDCEQQYKVQFDTYTCNKYNYVEREVYNVMEAWYTTRGDSGDTINAYCINPDFEFSSKSSWKSIDATKCVSSNSTDDCGYANILIEGYYRYHDQSLQRQSAIIGAAMRLWGAYIDEGGYTQVGIADEDETTIGSDRLWLKFVEGPRGRYENMFENTVDAILNGTYVNDLYSVDSVNDINASIGCSRIGVMCAGGYGSNYVKSVHLFINTLTGNPDMQKHLDEILMWEYGANSDDLVNDVENEPESATMSVDGDKVTFSYKLREDVEIDCTKESDDPEIKKACKNAQKVTIVVDGGGQIVQEADYFDYCTKNLCFTTFTLSVICTKINDVKVEVDASPNCGANSIKKYVACGSNSTHQTMFSFEPDQNCGETSSTRKTIEPYYECENCKQVAESSSGNCYRIDGTEVNLIKSNGDTYSRNEKLEPYIKHTAHDPNLNCILHKTSDSNFSSSSGHYGRDYYDYSSTFKVNPEVCKIYCSDKVTYFVPNRKEIFSSLQLSFDITDRRGLTRVKNNSSLTVRNGTDSVFNDPAFAARPGGTTNAQSLLESSNSNFLTNMVLVQRECVSKIYLNEDYDFNVDWGERYDVDGEQLIEEVGASEAARIINVCSNGEEYPAIDNLRVLLCRLNELSKHQNSRKEIMNDLLYDLYNCNFKAGNLPSSVRKPKDATNALEIANNILDNTEEYCTTPDKCVSGTVTYEGGAEYVDPVTDGGNRYTNVGQSGSDPVFKNETKVWDTLNIKYCGDNCFRGDPDGDEYYQEDSDAATTTSSSTSLNLSEFGTINIPNNNYVLFTYTIENSMYNNSNYLSQEYTGSVINTNDNRYTSEQKAKYLSIPSNTYPVSSIAETMCLTNVVGANPNNPTNYCDIFYHYDIPVLTKYNNEEKTSIIAFDRKTGRDDLISQNFGILSDDGEANNYSCYYEVSGPPGECEDGDCKLGFMFRNIDLGNPVPTDRDTIPALDNSNWDPNNITSEDSEFIQKVILELQQSDRDYLYATDKYLEYSYVITPDSIRAIRAENDETNGGYYSESLSGCKINAEEDKYIECRSSFLNKLHSDSNPFQVQIIKDDGKSEFTREKERLEGIE